MTVCAQTYTAHYENMHLTTREINKRREKSPLETDTWPIKCDLSNTVTGEG